MATIFTDALGSDRADSQGSFRCVIPITGGALDQVRVRFVSHSGLGWATTNVSIGIWTGVTMKTTATPVELLFSGSSGFSIGSGSTITSDWVNLTGFTSSDKLVVVMDFTSSAVSMRTGVTGVDLNYLFGAVASYNSADPTGLGGWGSGLDWVYGVNLIETQSTGGGGDTLFVGGGIRFI